MGVSEEDFWRKWMPTSVIEAALPRLGDTGFDWQKPLSEWPREHMIMFLREFLHIVQIEMCRREKITPFDDEIPWL
jgi:hypothetical protein